MRTITTTWSLSYRTAADSKERTVTIDDRGVARPSEFAHELGLAVRSVQGTSHLTKRASIAPTVSVEVTSVSVVLGSLGLPDADALFLNGYNSWTDSVERSPLASMRGLAGVPKAVVDQWVLDGSGDYRFVRQSPLPGRQHGMGYGYLRFGDQVLLVGSLDEDSGFTVLRESAREDTLTLEKEPPARVIEEGEERELVTFAVCEGALDEAFGRYVRLMGVERRPCAPLVGFSSWYRHYDQIDRDKLSQDLDAVTELFAGRDLGPCEPVFQIDDGYATVGDWTNPHADRFPDGLAPFAWACRERGLVPGLWMAPFVCSIDSVLFRDHPAWILRDERHVPVMTGSHWNGACALDTRNPEVRAYVSHALDVATREWGFKLLKLDFLYGACMLAHDGMNRGELMADALELLRASVPEGTMFDLCGVPMMSAFGRTEYCRIGCDVGLDWDDVPYMRLLHRERVSTKNSLANTRGRAHLDGVVFRNDPDVFFLRDDVQLTDVQRSDLLMADATLGGVFFTSDNVGAWSDAQRATFEKALQTFVNRERA